MKMKNNVLLSFIFTAIVLISLLLTNIKSPELAQETLIDESMLSSSVVANLQPVDNPKPIFNIEGQSALARELNGEIIFYELEPEQRWPIASLTKLMTGVVALENLKNEKLAQDLIRIMILTSSNEATDSLADMRGKEQFVKAMNLKSQELGMAQTSFFDASGLSFLNQSTVNDLYKLVYYISVNHPQILQWSREKELIINAQKYININKFVNRSDFLGGKTGYTEEANGNLISIFSSPKKPILIIVLGTANKIERFEQTKNLLEWIFQYYKL